MRHRLRLHRLIVAGASLACALRADAKDATQLRPWGPLDEATRATATDVKMAPAPNGRFGAWLVTGPFRSSTWTVKRPTSNAPNAPLLDPPPGVDDAHLTPTLGGTCGTPRDATHPAPTWQVAWSSDGSVDVKTALQASESDVIGYAAGTLHLEEAGRYYLLLGVDDGVRVFVDDRPVFLRDDPRPQRDDDDVVPLDLTAGDHKLLLKLHQRDGAWRFGARVVGADFAAPRGAYLSLPGTTASDAAMLAAHLSWVSIDRGLTADGYSPHLTVRFPDGAPRGVRLAVRAKLARSGRDSPAIFDLGLGEVPRDASGTGDLVATLPTLGGDDLTDVEAGDGAFEFTIAGRTVRAPFIARKSTREAVARALRTLPPLETTPRPTFLADGSLESVRHLEERLVHLVAHGDFDLEAQKDEAKELDDAARMLERGVDPYATRTGPMRRAYRSPSDGTLSEFGLYVPPSYRPDRARRYPLIVVLHGMNGTPLAMLRWFFGGDDPKKEQPWEDRHVGPLDPIDAFVVTPGGYGNAMYRELGEDDVMRVVDWALARYPIDRDRVSITGPSMGGIGTAAIALRRPDVFSAAAPLCGYHSYFVRRDVLGRPLRPWERFLAEERSNVEWASNGARLPLWIVHGTQDLPEANSGVLIERYTKLGFSVKHDHPNLGHNVWQTTYEDPKMEHWLASAKRSSHPREVSIRTARLRTADDAWLHVDELRAPDAWGEVRARARTRSSVDVTTSGVAAFRLDRDEKVLDPNAPLKVTIDGTRLTLSPGDAPIFHLAGGTGKAWALGPNTHPEPWKHGELTGPFRDVFHSPLLFVYGTDDPPQTRTNEDVARAWSKIRSGVTAEYPVMSDSEFMASGEPLANDRALFLVGNARSNRLVRALEPDFPIRVEGEDVVVGGKRLQGAHLGAAFIRPNPKRLDRYVTVIEGADSLATWRSLSLPDLLPDFVVYDERVAKARGQVLLGSASVRAGGFFGNDWSLPEQIQDPLTGADRPEPKSEYDATPYLP